MNKKNKELIKNTGILFLGRICTQFVSFLLIPIYTNYLIASDYGYVDLIQTYITLLAPIVILRLDSSIFRFLIDARNNEYEKNEIISSSICIIIFQILVLILLFGIINIFLKFNYWIGIVLNIVFISISSYLLQLTRGIGKNVDYSIASIISAIITVGINIILIIFFKYNASSILYASACANIICSLFLMVKNKLYKNIRLKQFNLKRLKEMLRYSLPMIPDGLSWWIVNVSDRTIISILIDTAANGIYAVSSKFSNILSSAFQIFNMSWQESASLHIEDSDRDAFFTNILNKTYMIFYSICILILSGMPFIFDFFIGNEYITAYFYIPILLLGNLFNALANIIGGVYIAKKETRKVARTTIMAALINITINMLLVKKIGLYAAAISTLISYIIVAVYRFIDVKKYINMRLNYKTFIISMLVFIISSLMYYINNQIINCINLIFVVLIVIFSNRRYINLALKRIKMKI